MSFINVHLVVNHNTLNTQIVDVQNSVVATYDTVYVEPENGYVTIVDTVPYFDTTRVVVDSVRYIDSTIIKEIFDPTKPKLGTIYFSDSSNIFTNVSVAVDFPYGQRTLEYRNKYKMVGFRKYVGLGYFDGHVLAQGNLFYGKLGLELALNEKGKFGYSILYRF